MTGDASRSDGDARGERADPDGVAEIRVVYAAHRQAQCSSFAFRIAFSEPARGAFRRPEGRAGVGAVGIGMMRPESPRADGGAMSFREACRALGPRAGAGELGGAAARGQLVVLPRRGCKFASAFLGGKKSRSQKDF